MSATRSRPEMDWDDIRHLVKLHHLDPGESEFRAMILRHGGEKALAKIEDIWHDPK